MISPCSLIGVTFLQAIQGVLLTTWKQCPKTLTLIVFGSDCDGYDSSNLQVVLQSDHIGPHSPLSSLLSSVFLPLGFLRTKKKVRINACHWRVVWVSRGVYKAALRQIGA